MAKKDLDSLFDYGVNIAKRSVYLFGEITEERAARVIKGLRFLDTPRKKITLYINSMGGNIYDAFAIYDVCRSLKSPLEIIVVGTCMSAATIILLAGTKGRRFVSKNLSLMVHHGSYDISGRFKDVTSETRHIRNLEKRWHEIFAKHTSKTKAYWDKICEKSDYYFGAKQAIQLKLADKIWNGKSPRKKAKKVTKKTKKKLKKPVKKTKKKATKKPAKKTRKKVVRKKKIAKK